MSYNSSSFVRSISDTDATEAAAVSNSKHFIGQIDGTIDVYNVSDGNFDQNLDPDIGNPNPQDIILSDGEEYLIAGFNSDPEGIVWWDTNDLNTANIINVSSRVQEIDISPDNESIAAAEGSGDELQIYDRSTGDNIAERTQGVGTIGSVSWDPQGDYVAVADQYDGLDAFHLVSTNDWSLAVTISSFDNTDIGQHIQFIDGGNYFVGTAGEKLGVWDRNGTLVDEFTYSTTDVEPRRLSSAGIDTEAFAVSVRGDDVVDIYSVGESDGTGWGVIDTLDQTFGGNPGHSEWSPDDGHLVLGVDGDGSYLWDIESGVEEVEVVTEPATDVGDNEATLNGSLESIGSGDEADVWFDYKLSSDTTWSSTTTQTLTSTGSFSEQLSELEADTSYDFRAQSEGLETTDTGSTRTFTTGGDATRHGITFDETVNAVDDLGMDNTGTDPVEDILAAEMKDGRLIEFPAGDYKISNDPDTDVIVVDEAFERAGMRGLGDSREDVRFFFPNAGESTDGLWFWRNQGESSESLLVENLSFDFNPNEDSTVAHLRFDCQGDIQIHDFKITGWIPRQSEGFGQLIQVDHRYGDEDSVSNYSNISIGEDGVGYSGHSSTTGDSPGFTYIRAYGYGEHIFEDLYFPMCGGNMLRSTSTWDEPPGTAVITVRDSYFANGDLSMMRFQGGDHPTKNSSIKNCEWVIDHENMVGETYDTKPYNVGGLMVESNNGDSGLLVEDCEFECLSVDQADDGSDPMWGFIRTSSAGDKIPGGWTMRDCRVYNATELQTIWIQEYDEDSTDEPGRVKFDNVDITLDNDYQQETNAIYYLQGPNRDDSEFINGCIHTEYDINGIQIDDSDDCLIEDSNINVGGEIVVTNNATVTTNNISTDGTCTLPHIEEEDDDTRRGITFDETVNAVDDLGMDPTGSEPIDSDLSAAWETGTLIEFPEGDYYVEDTRVVVDDADRVGMLGLGDEPKDVRFFFPDFEESEFFIINSGGSGVLFENFVIDCGPDEDTIAAISTRGDDDIWAVDLEWLGFYPRQESTPGALLWIQANDVDGVATARRITMGKHGSAQGGHSSSTGTSPGYSYIRNEEGHVGEFRLEDSHLEQCGHNTMRSSNNDGVVTAKNCFIKNADISGLRFNGGDHPEKTSLIENCHFLVDHRELNDTGETDPHHAMSGVFADTRVGNAGLVVRDCDFEWKHILQETIDNDGSLWGMIRVPSSGESNPGGITIENCRLYNDTIVPPIWINEISTNGDGEEPNQPWEVTLDDVNITMDEDETSQDDWNILIEDDRDDSVVKNSCIYSPGGSMDGIVLENIDNVLVEDSNINVGGEKVVTNNATVTTDNITTGDTCPLPSVLILRIPHIRGGSFAAIQGSMNVEAVETFNLLEDGLVSRWNFEDDSDTTTIVDSFGTNDGENNGATYTTTSEVDDLALAFDRVDEDYVDFGQSYATDGRDTFSLTCWFYPQTQPTDDDDYTLFGARDDWDNYIWLTYRHDDADDLIKMAGTVQEADDGPWEDIEVNIDAETYHHAALTFDTDTVRVYLDGTEIVSDTDTDLNGGPNTEGGLWIGGLRGTNRYGDVILDDCREYNRALTADEVSDIASGDR